MTAPSFRIRVRGRDKTDGRCWLAYWDDRAMYCESIADNGSRVVTTVVGGVIEGFTITTGPLTHSPIPSSLCLVSVTALNKLPT